MRHAVIVLLGLGLAGCASIFSGNSDQITVNSLESGSVIYVDGHARGKDVTNVQVDRGKGHTIVVKKEGCQDATAETGWSFDARSLLGVFIDLGIISIPVDFAIGGAMATDPTTYTVSPVCPDQPTTA
jgi:PEGA domain